MFTHKLGHRFTHKFSRTQIGEICKQIHTQIPALLRTPVGKEIYHKFTHNLARNFPAQFCAYLCIQNGTKSHTNCHTTSFIICPRSPMKVSRKQKQHTNSDTNWHINAQELAHKIAKYMDQFRYELVH